MGLPRWAARKGLSEEVVVKMVGFRWPLGEEIVVTATLFLLCPNGSSRIETPFICSLALEGFDHGLEVRDSSLEALESVWGFISFCVFET